MKPNPTSNANRKGGPSRNRKTQRFQSTIPSLLGMKVKGRRSS
ncbi:hypothetical protein LEP1GSC058_0266 [Leptospira fainei serovar Hurstbridge str. BUT 6]|uniref:Uncharacterized protein n=1 Tax=Leptospira fainei serovar Hurstbridge str. BUT 6 TaxID=1193011 RepID=S3UVU6_9LEPT|nr:hypothetical protein LEP1GSC058_0266 [Leptospira fainei serovar Hurstbridge str. BUT 6]